MTEVEFAEFVEAVCKRPKMYTPTGSFFEVISFLDGFGSAAIDIEENAYHSALTPFLLWLAEPDDQGRRFPISTHELKERSSSDEEALAGLPLLYLEYVNSGRRE